jgi:pilus assembly protein CpaB
VRRRLLAAVAALVLAAVGALVLVAYARGADQRAMAGTTTVQVLVVAKPVPEGTPATALPDLVRTELLPAKAATPGRVRSLRDIAGQVATTDLKPGEQLLASRFAAPSSLRTPGTVDVPKGDQEVSVLLEPQRAVGGRLAAGNDVGVYVSYKLPDGTGLTHVVLHKVLVTQVQGAAAPASSSNTAAAKDGTQAAAATPAPSQSLIVTLAVTSKEAEPIVWGMEHGTIWLALEPDGADTSGTTVIGPGNVYTEAYQ